MRAASSWAKCAGTPLTIRVVIAYRHRTGSRPIRFCSAAHSLEVIAMYCACCRTSAWPVEKAQSVRGSTLLFATLSSANKLSGWRQSTIIYVAILTAMPECDVQHCVILPTLLSYGTNRPILPLYRYETQGDDHIEGEPEIMTRMILQSMHKGWHLRAHVSVAMVSKSGEWGQPEGRLLQSVAVRSRCHWHTSWRTLLRC